jgi:hypothetical protein
MFFEQYSHELSGYPAVGAWLKRVAGEGGHVPREVAW